jgi:hypothetical protein
MSEPTSEQIVVTVSGRNGVALINLDTTRRLRALGFRRNKGAGLRSAPHSQTQAEYLKGYPAIRDLAHLRHLIDDDRSEGCLITYKRGDSLLMERNDTAKSGKVWYLVLDTAIGASPKFLSELKQRGAITITDAPDL